MINIKHILNVGKKELRGYFDSPTAYIVLVLFLFLWEYLFFRDVFIVGEASLRILLSYLPWLFLILIPALTMGAISAEKNEGTLEFLLTQPLKIIELILGKFLAAFGFVLLSLLFMFPVAISLNQYGNLDLGEVVGQFVGSLLLAATFISLGIAVSSFLKSQIASLLLSIAIGFMLIIVGTEVVTLSLPPQIANIFEQVSIMTRFNSLARGVIDVRDLWYFAAVNIIFISVAYLQILKIRIGNQKELYRTSVVGVVLFSAIAILITIVGMRFPYRFDLTQGKSYQLTQSTRDTLAELNDVVNIKLYASGELPAQLRPILRDTKDILRDYQTYGRGKVRINVENPSANSNTANEANSLGIREVQFNVIGNEELQLKKGYLGLAVLYGGQTEVIPLISSTNDLEYQLTSYLRKLTTNDKKTVAFLTGHGEKDPAKDYPSWKAELDKQFNVSTLTLKDGTPIPEEVTTIVVAGPTQPIDEKSRQQLAEFFKAGGSLLMLLDPVSVQPSLLAGANNANSMADFVSAFGIDIGQDIVYDVRSGETVNFGNSGGMNFVIQYPFWPRATASAESNPLTSKIKTLVLPWPSSLKTNDKLNQLGYHAATLFTTSQYGSKQQGVYNLKPDQQLLPTEVSQIPLAMSLIGDQTANGKVARMIVVGDSSFLEDQFVSNNPENLAFGDEALSWLAEEKSLAEIQLKQHPSRQLTFKDQSQMALIKYGNLGLVIGIPLLIGVVRLVRRKSLRNLTYAQAYE